MQVKNCHFISRVHRSGLSQTVRVRCYTDGENYRVDAISDVEHWGEREHAMDEGGVSGKHRSPAEQDDHEFWVRAAREAMRRAAPWAPAWRDDKVAGVMRTIEWRVVRAAAAVRR